MKVEKRQCDILCAGGGVAGLMAGIRARELGANVIVADKSDVRRSGAAAVGCDHFMCYIPEVHGDSKAFSKELNYGQMASKIALIDTEDLVYLYEKSFDIVKLWDSWGIPMKYEGRWEFAGHTYPGRQGVGLKYSGQNQKLVLNDQALKRGIDILNRVMIFDVLTDGKGNAIGALGIDCREDKLYEFEAKAVFLGTGGCVGLYPGPTHGKDAVRNHPKTSSGDGRAMAYRAGAELGDLELTARHAGPKGMARSGQGTWVGVLRDRYDRTIGPYVTKPEKLYGDMTIETSKVIFDDYKKSGKGPIYMDMRGISDADLEYMLYWLIHEGNTALTDYLKEEGIDLKKNPVEFMTFEMAVAGGIHVNHKGETAVKGLYAAGDECAAIGGGIASAAIIGWSAGENAAKYIKRVKTVSLDNVRAQINRQWDMVKDIRERDVAAKWQEAYYALQLCMEDYCGSVRSQTMLEAGSDYIGRIKTRVPNLLMAENAHELMHCLEAINAIDVAQAVFTAALDRKETRGRHIRSDYPLNNAMLSDQIHLIKLVNGNPAIEWRQVKK